MPLQRVPLNNFRGGLNTRDGPFDLQPNESPDLLNVTLTSLVGQLKMRAGKTRFDTSGMPAAKIDNAQQIVLGTSTRWLMCSINGAVYSCDTAGILTLRFTGTAATVWSFVQFIDATGADMVWMQNGVDAPQKWNGVAASTSAWAGAPPNGGILRVWRNKMVVSGVAATNNRVFFSKFGDPELTTGAYDFLDMRGPDDEADAVTEMNVLADRLYVFNSRSIWVVNDPVSLSNRRVGQPGCTGRFQSDVLESKLYWFNEQGLWSTGGVAVELETGAITNYFPSNLNLAQVGKARVLATRDSYPRLLLAIPTGASTVNNALIELIPHINFRRIGGRRYLLLPAFMLHDLTCMSLCNFKVSNQWLVMAGDSQVNKLYKVFSGSDDDADASTILSTNLVANPKPSSNTGWTAGLNYTIPTVPTLVTDALSPTGQALESVGSGALANQGIEITLGTLAAGTYSYAIYVRSISGATALNAGIGQDAAPYQSSSVNPANIVGGSYTRFTGTLVLATGGIACSCFVGNPAATASTFRVAAVQVTQTAAPQTYFDGDSKAAVWTGTPGNSSSIQYAIKAISAKWQSSWMAIQGEEPFERVRRVNVELSGNAIVDVYSDFKSGPDFSATLLDPGGGLDNTWDNPPHTWDETGTWDPVSVFRFVRVRPESRGRFHSIKFRNAPGGTPFLINIAELAIRGGKEH